MSQLKKWVTCMLAILIGFFAQSQKVFFEQLTTAEGLPSDYVNCLFEDSKGYLWIGTDKGACRYDGRQFQYFSNDNGLPSNFVSCFEEDPAGNIWIGTVDAGACLFDGKKLIPFSLSPNEKASIRDIHFNADSSFFIVSESFGLSFYQDAKATPRLFKNFSFIKKLEENKFLTGVSDQLYILEKRGKNLDQLPQPYPAEKGNLFAWLSDENFVVLSDSSILCYTINGKKWIVKSEFVVKQLTDWKDFKKVFVNNTDVQTKGDKLNWRDIKKIFIRNKELFIATSDGLIYVDGNNKQTRFTEENGLGTNFLKTINTDRHNNIYLCTYGGGIKIWPAGYLAEFKINGKVTSLFPAGNETYITTTKSFYRFNDSEKKIIDFRIPVTANFTAVYKNANQEIFLGTLTNFYRLPAKWLRSHSVNMNIKSHSYYAHSGTSGFASNRSHTFISTYGDGVYVVDDKNKIIDTLNSKDIPPAPNIIESLVPLGNSVAALTYNSGLTIYDPINKLRHLSRQEGLLSNTVYSGFKENENAIWIGTKNGLNLFDGKRIIKTFTANEGLSGTNVLCIFKDKLDRFWILSDRFLHLLDDGRLRAIRSQPILFDKKNSINRAAYCTNTNKLFIGLTDALLTVDMNKIVLDTVVNIPKLLEILKDSLVLSIRANELLSMSNPGSKITFRFAGSYNSFIRQSDLYYKLKGFDDNWNLLAGTNDAFYQKLTPGKYELLAKTINPDGYSSPEFSLLFFEVLPPLWKRTWFIAVMSAIMLAIFFYIGNLLSRKRYRQKLRHLEEEYRLQLERERIARELHDNVGSQLTYLINRIDDDYPKLSEKNEAEKLSSVARGAMQELRETIWALDKKEVQWDDLQNKIRQLIRLYKTETHDVQLDWNVNDQPPLNPLEALNIYRIIQETLNNSEKYSGASFISVAVSNKNGRIHVEIKDNGKGFDVQQTEGGYGLKNMKKRAEEMNAILQIQSTKGAGTTVKLHLP